MLNEEFRSHSPTSPLHQKRHLRSICLSGCFSGMSTHPFDVLDNDADYYHNSNNQRARTPPPRSPLPEIKGRCMQLISKIGGGVRSGRVRRRNASADFSYDPSSYALNFEDDACKADDQLLNGFSARLSASSIPTTPHERKINRNALDDILESEEELAAAAAANENNAKSRANGGVPPRSRGRSRHSSSSVDFSYEPSSYARNFEDDVNRGDEMISLRRFGGLLAQPKQSLTVTTPPPAKCSALGPEIAAFS
ncbi:hypothetical protein ACFX1X_017495 [Malus domestica]